MPKFKLRLALALALGLAIFASQGLANTPATTSNQAVILLYHHISSRTPPSTSTSLHNFLQHLEYLEQEGFEVWPLERIANQIKRRRPLPNKTAAITFDDAYVSVYETALPYLQERNLPFTIFVNARQVERKHPLYMSWQQLKEAKAAGATIANHGYEHLYQLRKLKLETPTGLEEESEADWLARVEANISNNQKILEKQLGKLPKLFAHPYGEYNQQIEDLLRKQGYVGFGQQSGPASPYSSIYALPRFSASGPYADLTNLRVKLESLALPVVSTQPASRVLDGTDKKPSLELILAPGDYRINQLRCYGPGSQILNVKAVQQPDKQIRVNITSRHQLEAGRPRYNCTAPHQTENRYYWFTFQWVLPNEDGSWPR